MTMRVWALKVGELKPLSRAGLLLLMARCAQRVEPWLPPGADALWNEALDVVVGAAFDGPPRANAKTMRLARELSNRGATACNRLAATDNPLGRCRNYATSTLANAVKASTLEALPELKKAAIESAKLSASIAGVLAHAGRIKVPRGQDPVAVACVAIWDVIRADIPRLAVATSEIEIAKKRVRALRESAPVERARARLGIRQLGLLAVDFADHARQGLG